MDNGSGKNKRTSNDAMSTIEAMDAAIVSALLQGENVVIPGFGYLEPKFLPNRRTVLFRAAGSQDPVMKQFAEDFNSEKGSHSSVLYDNISVPLKAGNTVSLSKLGVFHPIKKEDGTFRVSFTPSSSLRQILNGESPKELTPEPKKESTPEPKEENVSTAEVQKEKVKEEIGIRAKDKQVQVKEGVTETTKELDNKEKESDNVPKVVNPEPEKVKEPRMPSIKKEETQKARVIAIPQDEKEKPKKKNSTGLILAIVALVVLLIVIFSVFHNKREESSAQGSESVGSMNLPCLAEQYYGNPIFWVYIYEANQDKLNSPVNIPAGVKLIIPDLSEFNVDITDSLEIKRAKVKSDMILNLRY